MPVTVTVPQDAPLQPGPETLQLTERSGLELGAGVRVAVYCADAPALTDVGPVTTRVNVLVTCTAAAACLDGSATLCAVKVTFAGEGKICGAVKSPLESSVPQDGPAQAGPEMLQMTARLGLPELEMVA